MFANYFYLSQCLSIILHYISFSDLSSNRLNESSMFELRHLTSLTDL